MLLKSDAVADNGFCGDADEALKAAFFAGGAAVSSCSSRACFSLVADSRESVNDALIFLH